MLLLSITIILLGSYVAAKSSTTATNPSATSTRAISAFNTTSEWPVTTMFLPIDVPNNLGASVITAAPDETAYAIGCIRYSDTDKDCGLSSPFVLTEGESTLVYTMTYSDDEGTATGGATIHCVLRGGTRATAATCTGKSAVSGLGTALWTSTLASTQISYSSVTITAGMAELTSVPGPVGGKAESTGTVSANTGGAIAGVTSALCWAVGGIALIGVL